VISLYLVQSLRNEKYLFDTTENIAIWLFS